MPVFIEVGDISGGGAAQFSFPIEVTVNQNNRGAAPTPVVGAQVRIKKSVTQVAQGATDGNGEYSAVITEPSSAAGKTIIYKAIYGGESATAIVTFPAATDSSSSTDDNPTDMVLDFHHDPNWTRVTVIARVTKDKDVGHQGTVNLNYDGRDHSVNTDRHGNATHRIRKNLIPAAGEELHVFGTVSGIKKIADLKIKRPKARPAPMNFFWWLIRKNNGRAVLFGIITLVAIIYGFSSVGWGDPVYTQLELSPEQIQYNKMTGKEVFEPAVEESRGGWQVYYWLILAGWGIFTIIYAPWSMREEVIEALEEGWDAVLRRGSVKVGDPMYEKIAAWSGSFASAHRKPEVVINNTAGASGQEASNSPKDGTPFWRMFKSDLLADMLVEVVPRALRGAFRR